MNPLKAAGAAIFSPSKIGPEEYAGPGIQIVSRPREIVEASPTNEKAEVPSALKAEAKIVPAKVEPNSRPGGGGIGERGATGAGMGGSQVGDRVQVGPMKDLAGI
jgi:hypothetical protein